MDKHISILSLSLTILAIFRVSNCVNHASICAQTPNPESCNTLITTPPKTLAENVVDLRDVSVRATLAQAGNAQKLISDMDLSSFSKLAKSAWADCMELYDDTVYRLNRSIGSKIDAFDVQTWLSAAIANEQACHNGFLDFNLSSHLESFQFKLNKFSNLLSNSLAINTTIASSSCSLSSAALYGAKPNRNRRLLSADAGNFPGWVPAGDRKLLQSSTTSVTADIVVAQDGSGDYRTISEAVTAAAKRRKWSGRFVVYVKKGIYRENVEVKKSVKNLMLVGDGIDATVVTGSRNVVDGFTTFRSATFAVSGDGFIAKGMTFENSAGPHKHQAVALRSGSDFSVFYDCSFKGYQDTLYVHSMRQFYRDCHIHGTIDFIFDDASAIIQSSNIYLRKPMPGQKNTVTAQGRKNPNENTGIIIHNSIVTASSELKGVQGSYRSFLGRPWKKYSRTVLLKCLVDGVIDPAGWLECLVDGADTDRRVKWPGFRVMRSPIEAWQFSVGKFLAGDSWIQATGVPFDSGVFLWLARLWVVVVIDIIIILPKSLYAFGYSVRVLCTMNDFLYHFSVKKVTDIM